MRRALIGLAVALGALAAAAPAQGFVYWANWGPSTSGGTTIGRANNDGTGKDNSFIGGAQFPCGVAINDTHIFWGNNEELNTGNPGTTIGRANIDGTGVNQSFVTGASSPCGPAVDDSFLYWANFDTGTIGRANVADGSGANPSFVTGTGACSIAADETHLWWANDSPEGVGRATIAGASPNPTFIPITPGGTDVCGVAVNSAHVYWTAAENGVIGRANLDGSGVDQDFIAVSGRPCGVAVDDTYVYWAELFPDASIGRARLDGTEVQNDFITGLAAFPCGVAVDDGIRTSDVSVTCSPAGAALSQPSTCTAQVADTNNGVKTPPAGTVSFSSASGGAFFQGPSSCALAPATPSSSSCSVVYRPGFGANLVLGFYQGDAAHEGSTDVGQVTVSSYSLGAVSFDRRAGTATLIANAPGPGVVEQNGERTVPGAVQTPAAGPVSLVIQATGQALRKLKRTGSVTVLAETDFTPAGGGQDGIARTPVRLVKNKKKKKKKKR
jgi:virginiamycin B lyase